MLKTKSSGDWRSKIIGVAIGVVAVAGVLYHMVATQYYIWGPTEHQNAHLLTALLLVSLVGLTGKSRFRKLWLLVGAASLICTIYVFVNFYDLELRVGQPTGPDVVIGWTLLIAVLVATWSAFGPVLPIVSTLGIAYMFIGPYVPGVLQSPPLAPERVISFTVIGLSGGLYGTLLQTSANYIFLFVIYGGLLGAVSATRCFEHIGRLVASRAAGGSALTAVVASSLVGMVSGAPAANVAVCGAFTIPAMKREGRKPEEAAAYESCASTGGSILPPVMGVSAFIMAGMLGIPYIRVCAMSLIPALLYFLNCGLQAQITGVKKGLSASTQKADFKVIWQTAPVFFLPLGVLTYLMVKGYSPMFAIFWTIVGVLVVSLFRKETRPSFGGLLKGCRDGAIGAARIGVACACVGPFVAALTVTLLGVKLPSLVEILSGGIMPIALVLAAIAALILGCGLPGMAVFILIALIAAPTLVYLGIPKDIAYLFSLYYACFAAMTPPVAMASIVAAKMANANYWKTGWYAVLLGNSSLILPFLFVWSPAITLSETNIAVAIQDVLAATVAIACISLAIWSFYLTKLNRLGVALAAASAAGLLGFLFTRWYPLLVAGALCFILLTIWQIVARRRDRLTVSLATG